MDDNQTLGIFIKAEIDVRINFAMQQNDVPVVRAVQVENKTENALKNLRLNITAEPEFAEPWEALIEKIPEGGSYKLDAVDIVLSPSYLAGLTERLRGHLRFEVLSDEEKLAEKIIDVELLAHDEWGGLSSLPEILAAFVTPNHAAVEQILRQVSDLLEKWTGDPSISGYQSGDRARAWMFASAIYCVLQSLKITYLNPPASFENEGQRVRLPDRIMENRLAACLDISLITAACLEQAGLHPLVIIVRGHVFVGVWLVEECFGEPAIDDLLRLRKRVDLNEIGVFDPTYLTAATPVDFDHAAKEAKRQLSNPGDFLCLIDIKRARKGQIRPLPVGFTKPSEMRAANVVQPNEIARPSMPDLAVLATPYPPLTATKEDTPQTRVERWRRRLLDLTLRNRLINFKITKKTIPLLCPNLAVFEDSLAEGAVFKIRPRPPQMSANDPRDPDSFRRRTGDDVIEQILREDLRSKILHSDLTQGDLERRLLEIYRTARVGIEEGGASALYLAVGFLLWYESATSQVPRYAPILLLPVDLHRPSVLEGFTLRLSDEEARLNVTLLELLKKDHGVTITGMDPLPEDESGLDVPMILRVFREKIRDIDRWDVIEGAHIGIFSFAKFLMWRDLTERTDNLLENKVVDHLVNRPDQAFEPDAEFPNPDRMDSEKSPLDTFCPLPADASQLAAIFAAEDGRSYVLEGPPGTGKSQTIANLVAHCLAIGRTVLFVSEKMAALNVVQNRLRNVGLGSYCLELHSQKARKSEVLAQLQDALDHYERFSPGEWEREARRLEGLRSELNAYVQAMHTTRTTGETIFQAVSNLIGLKGEPFVKLSWPSPDHFDAEGLARLRDLVERLVTVGGSAGNLHDHPWAATAHPGWTPIWENQVADALENTRDKLEALINHTKSASERLSLGEGGWSYKNLKLIERLSRMMLDSPGPPDAMLVRADWEEIQDMLERWIKHGQKRDSLRAGLYSDFTEKILSLDLDEIENRYKRARASLWPFSWWRMRPVRKAIGGASKGGTAPEPDRLASIIETAKELREEEKTLSDASDEARTILGRFWNEGEAHWEELASLREWAIRFRALAGEAAGDDFDRAEKFRNHWARMATEGRAVLAPDAAIGQELRAYISVFSDYILAVKNINSLLELELNRAWGPGNKANFFKNARMVLQAWLDNMSRLSDWCAWLRVRKEGIGNGLSPLIEAYENGQIDNSDLKRIFDHSYYRWWHTELVSRENVLAHFFSPEHEKKIESFRSTDDRYTQLTKSLVASRLAEKVPNANAVCMNNSEMGILRREISKKRRHMPVRKLLQTVPNLLARLKPCLLMSPISVAQYLDTSYPPFDLVVFDEASQIPVWDAVGAIARGKSVIVVGDPKQLPPTAFFQRVDEADDETADDGLVEDLESILDECIGAQLPFRSLQWHYRSRHESLIAFSNYHYYDNRLLTFPSPFREGMGVQWHFVDKGIYDRGKSSTNREEANAVVEEILRRLRDGELQRLSIGVVTFSMAQQTLIEDLLEEVRRDDPEIDFFFSDEAPERAFVKNLENVQGDERDVILFSICYGPDIHGKITMNFGPMNRDGGERRLNVAITRARQEVVVFSSLRADQIDLTKTRARGIRDLKNFLEYAERGPAALSEAVRYDPEADFDSPFEKEVHDALVEKGWTVHLQVGCARYRIDLAVVDPENPGRYLLGIECDGANYHRAKSARDRDKLREGVLRDLGWRLHRIWSTDWWKRPNQEFEKLQAALKNAEAERIEHRTTVKTNQKDRDTESIIPTKSDSPDSKKPASFLSDQTNVYKPYSTSEVYGPAENFYETHYDPLVRQLSIEIVHQEGPISIKLLTSRVAKCWDLNKVTQKAQNRVFGCLTTDTIRTSCRNGETFLWPFEINHEEWQEFRVPNNKASTRDAVDLPVEEVANAVMFVLSDNISAPEEEIIREVSRIFGFRRAGSALQKRVQAGIEHLEKMNKVKRDDKQVFINNG